MAFLRQPSALPIVGVALDRRTYGHLAYLLLAIPLGFVYSTLLTFGVAFGLFLSVVLVGFVILLATLIGSRLVAGFERRLANALLGTDLRRADDLVDADGALAGVRTYLEAPSTWRGLGFLSLKFWVVLFAFVPFVLLANAFPLLVAPLRYPSEAGFGEVNGEPVTWAIDTLPEALLAALLGAAGVLLALHVTNLVAYLARQMAVSLLGRRGSDATLTAAPTATADRGPSEAPESVHGEDGSEFESAGDDESESAFDFVGDDLDSSGDPTGDDLAGDDPDSGDERS